MSELDVAVEDAASDTQPLVPTAAGPAGLDVQIAAELLERVRTEGVSLVGQGGLLQQVTRAVLQAALEAEMADHLGYQRGEAPPVGSGNHRNGSSAKTVRTEVDAQGRHRGEVSLADLIPVSLSLGVLRIIVGEVRGREIVAMLQAMTTSRGSICTIHARNPASVVDRAVELALTHGQEMTTELAQRMVAGALDLIVYVNVVDETRVGGRKLRYVSHVVEVIGSGDRGQVMTTSLFGPGADGRAVPLHHPERLRDPLLLVGYDSRHLAGAIAAGEGGWRSPLATRRRPR